MSDFLSGCTCVFARLNITNYPETLQRTPPPPPRIKEVHGVLHPCFLGNALPRHADAGHAGSSQGSERAMIVSSPYSLDYRHRRKPLQVGNISATLCHLRHGVLGRFIQKDGQKTVRDCTYTPANQHGSEEGPCRRLSFYIIWFSGSFWSSRGCG